MQAATELSFARTKIQPPRVRADLIRRPTLDAELQRALSEQRLTLILAPAGWGKTSALAQQLARLPTSTALAWVSADADDDLPRFLAGLTAALEPLDLPWRVSPSALGTLLQAERGLRLVADEIINALSESEAPRGLLVIDDAHRWSDPKLFELLATIVERLPGAWGLVIASRTEPTMPLARLRARGELTEFRQGALRFDTSEVKVLLQAQGLSPDQAEELHKRTEGWAAGLRLMLSVGKVAGQGGGRSQRDVFDYLADEVLAGMAPELRLFLLRCSVLPELTAERCAHVSALANAALLFQHIEREGLFVSPLDDAGRTLRLHDLFRDFLEERLQRECADEVPALLQRAADHEPDLLRAVNWLTRAGSLDRAATELATRGPALIHVGGRPAIERMLALFPVDHISSNPYLAFLRGQCNFQAFDFESLASAMADAVRGFRAVGNVELSFVAEFFLCFGQMNTGQLANVRDAADRLRANKPGGPAGALLGYLSAMLANAELRNDDVAPALSEMLDHLEAVPSHPIWDDLHFLAFFTSYPGAQCVLEKHDRAATRHIGNQATFLRVAVLHGRASRAFCQGRLQEAHSWLSSADEDLQWLGSPVSLVTENQQLHLAVDALLGIKESALQFAEKARADLSSSSKTNQRVHACSVLCGVIRTYWLLGEADSVRRIQRELQIAHNSWEWAGALVERALADGMVALLDGKPALAEKLLCADSVPRSWASFSIGAHAMVLGAEAQRLQGKLDAAAATLHRMLSDPATPSAFGGALVAGAPVLRNLANTVWGKRLSEVEQSELCRWAAIASGDTASEVAVEDGNALPAGLSAREAEVLALITKGQSNKLIARELGLSLFTVKRHVANILNKTSLGSRTELATWWLGLGRGH